MKEAQRFFTFNASKVLESRAFAIETIDKNSVPEALMERVADDWDEWYGENVAECVSNASRIRHPNGINTFIVEATATPRQGYKHYERRHYILHSLKDAYLGCIVVHKRLGHVESFPYVWNVESEEVARIGGAHQKRVQSLDRRGLAELGYHIANQICKSAYGQSLHSGAFNESSQGIWQKLVKQDLAVKLYDVELSKDKVVNTLGAFRMK